MGKEVVTAAVPEPKAKLVLAVPQFELSTKLARRVLPKTISMKDAISNLAAVSLLPHAFQKDETLLGRILNDRWHEPYRAKLIPGFYKVKAAALKAGAHGVALSGAGPTMISFVKPTRVGAVANAMRSAFARAGVKSQIMQLAIDKRGAVVK
jgi:homoserine kinase